MIGQIPGDARVKRLLDQLNYNYEITTNGSFKLVFDVGDGRSQVAMIDSATHTYNSIEIREIWSIALRVPGQVDQATANELLCANNSVKLGAWRIIFEEGLSYVAFAVHVPAETQISFLSEMLSLVVNQADAFEKAYLGTDEF